MVAGGRGVAAEIMMDIQYLREKNTKTQEVVIMKNKWLAVRVR